jgi:glycosyltransferase involved in cell wall biosynthesis
MANCFLALSAAYLAIAPGPGDEVISTLRSGFIATAHRAVLPVNMPAIVAIISINCCIITSSFSFKQLIFKVHYNMISHDFQGRMSPRLLIVVNVDWFFISHRLPIAIAAKQCGFEVHVATTFTCRSYKEALVSHGLLVHELCIDRSAKNVFRIIKNFFMIFALVQKLRPDLVHLVTIQPVLFGGLAARVAGVKRVVYAVSGLGHAFLGNSLASRFRRYCVKLLYRCSLGARQKIVIFQNKEDLEMVSSFCPLADGQYKIIPGSGVDLSRFVYTPIPRGVPVVQMASRLLATKGVREFVDAAGLLATRGVRARFQLIGEPDIYNPAAIPLPEIDEWKKQGIVDILGHRDDLYMLMQEAHIICLPSYREGLPKVLCEAAASGRPVVTTNVPGCRDSIEDGVTGLLVPSHDHIALADALEYLLKRHSLLIKLGVNARRRAEKLFDCRDVVDQHLKLYSTLLCME